MVVSTVQDNGTIATWVR